MSLKAPDNRRDYLFDLTRWNRAGLSRFEYVDGDAAVWLEELRITMLGLYLRGVDIEDRLPEKWRDLFRKDQAEWKRTASEDTLKSLESSAAWKQVFPRFPAQPETAGERNQRLLDKYREQSQDYTWEIMRAFARAAHVVLGYQNAYANEGYLRTATQWENVRKLAAMVNYQPTPPASATATVALEVVAGKGVIEIGRGLAMKYAPPAGGAPLVFETLRPVQVHDALNNVRVRDWNRNESPLTSAGVSRRWLVDGDVEVADGDIAVLTNGTDRNGVSLRDVEIDAGKSTAAVSFHPAGADGIEWSIADTVLWTGADSVQRGLPQTSGQRFVIKLDSAAAYSVGSLVAIGNLQGVVKAVRNGYLTVELNGGSTLSGAVEVEALTPFTAGESGKIKTPTDIHAMYFRAAKGSHEAVIRSEEHSRPQADIEDGIRTAREWPDTGTGVGYARLAGTRVDTGTVVEESPIAEGQANSTVRFAGAPPKTLSKGDWYVSRIDGESALVPLKVENVWQEPEAYHIRFDQSPSEAHHRTDFFGPMLKALRPVNHNRSETEAIDSGGVAKLDWEGVSDEARQLIKIGRDVIIVRERNGNRKAAVAVIRKIEHSAEDVRITLTSDHDLTNFEAGWTLFHLNTVDISHGETKDPKVLGSGDAEQERQDFTFKIKGVSFVPSNAAVTGVAPDMDVTVDGVKWEFRDYGDPTADGQDAWSILLNEDDTLQIHFRRRLPSGSNNLSVLRHRVGVGLSGSNVPAWAFQAPMKKNRFVTGVVQPFAATGGADREPVSDIRENAPSKLAANGRAVALKDFELLCRRHSSVWQAKARMRVGPAATNLVDIVVVPANGGLVGPTLKSDLIDFIRSRALPDVRVAISGYEALPVNIHVRVLIDTDRYIKSDVKDGVEAELLAAFRLRDRGLGQPLYVAEILAAVERVTGVASATIRHFDTRSDVPAPLRKADIGGSIVAIYPTEEQVAVVQSVSDITVDPESLVS